jgi:hypothetical protein
MKRKPHVDPRRVQRWNDAFYRQKLEHRLGDAPVQPEYQAQMVAIMQTLDEFLNGPKGPNYVKRNGIVIMMFPFDNFDGRCNYMSNGADRRDIVTLMKEMIARFEGQPELGGRA